MDDALLVSRAMAGDLDSFGQLYDSYFSRIYDFTWRILRDSDEAADATQDVFMKAMQALPGLTKAASFKSWLFTIAHNVAVTRAERGNRMMPLPSPVHEEAFGSFDVPDPCRLDNPELAAGDHEAAALVWEAASALNARDYALLDLHVRQGLESADIAGGDGRKQGQRLHDGQPHEDRGRRRHRQLHRGAARQSRLRRAAEGAGGVRVSAVHGAGAEGRRRAHQGLRDLPGLAQAAARRRWRSWVRSRWCRRRWRSRRTSGATCRARGPRAVRVRTAAAEAAAAGGGSSLPPSPYAAAGVGVGGAGGGFGGSHFADDVRRRRRLGPQSRACCSSARWSDC